jgi:hypothetical protein
MIVPAECIDLHAISSSASDEREETEEPGEPRTSLYLQIRSESEGSNGGDLIEWTLLPHGIAHPEDHERTTQALFDSLSELISLHPIDPNDDTDDEGGDEMIVAPPGRYCDAEATPEERQAMLERLDRILTVPPELEGPDAVEGQFDNAEDDDDEGRFDDAEDEDDVDELL